MSQQFSLGQAVVFSPGAREIFNVATREQDNAPLGCPFNRSLWGVHLTGVERRLGRWNVPMPAPTTLSLLGSFRLGSRLMQTAWTTWNGCAGLAASSARPVVIREDGGLGTAGSCVLDAVAAHQ